MESTFGAVFCQHFIRRKSCFSQRCNAQFSHAKCFHFISSFRRNCTILDSKMDASHAKNRKERLLFGVAINQLCFFYGLNLSSAINSGIIMTTNPVLVIILAYFLIKEKITLSKIAGILIAASGAILLTLAGSSGKGDSLLGDLFLFVNALSYAIYLVIAKPLMKKYNPLTVITYVFTFGLGFVLLFPPTLIEFFQTDFQQISLETWAKITYVIIGVTFLTYLLTMYGLKYLSPSVSSAYIYFQPVLVIFFAFFLSYIGFAEDYTDTITWQKGVYMLLIFAGVWLTTRKQKV